MRPRAHLSPFGRANDTGGVKTLYKPATDLATQLLEQQVVDRIWAREPAVWKALPSSADATSIETRLGWLDIAKTMTVHVERLKKLRDRVHAEHVEAVYLLGMGGSS